MSWLILDPFNHVWINLPPVYLQLQSLRGQEACFTELSWMVSVACRLTKHLMFSLPLLRNLHILEISQSGKDGTRRRLLYPVYFLPSRPVPSRLTAPRVSENDANIKWLVYRMVLLKLKWTRIHIIAIHKVNGRWKPSVSVSHIAQVSESLVPLAAEYRFICSLNEVKHWWGQILQLNGCNIGSNWVNPRFSPEIC